MIKVSSDNLIKASSMHNDYYYRSFYNTYIYNNNVSSNVIKKEMLGLSYEQKCSVGLLTTDEYLKWMYDLSKKNHY